MLWEVPDAEAGGLFSAATTSMMMRQCFFWPGMWNAVQDYAIGCDICMWVIQLAGNVVGLLQSIPVAQGRWEHMRVDFITDVQISWSANACILTFVDHLSQPADWIPCNKTIDAAGFAMIFLEIFFWVQGDPQEMISKGELQFAFDFWVEVSKMLSTKQLLSIAFHPQTDSMPEITNQQVTRYLQAFTTLPLRPLGHNASACGRGIQHIHPLINLLKPGWAGLGIYTIYFSRLHSGTLAARQNAEPGTCSLHWIIAGLITECPGLPPHGIN